MLLSSQRGCVKAWVTVVACRPYWSEVSRSELKLLHKDRQTTTVLLCTPHLSKLSKELGTFVQGNNVHVPKATRAKCKVFTSAVAVSLRAP